MQLSAADAWMPAERNLPLPESAWIRTGPNSRVEIELDDGGAWRLGPESQGGLSDYSRISTGQRVTLLQLEHGLAYFTGESKSKDSLMLVVPGAQVAISKPARVRIAAQDQSSQVAVLQGVVRFSSAAAEIDLAQGQTTRVEPGNASRFFLYREVTPLDSDRWNAARDKALATPIAALHVPERYGLADLDAAGQWIQTEDLGVVWKPKNSEGWAPYQRWPLALVQRARLCVGKRRSMGLAALSLRALDAPRRTRLGLGAVVEFRVQTRRSFLDAWRPRGWLGPVGAR